MKIRKTFNTTKKEIESKKYNILIPICVGNKFFLDKTKITENVLKYINWALKNTKGKVLILIVDKIQITNWVVRNKNNTFSVNLNRLMRNGKEIESNFARLIGKLSKERQNRVNIIRWDNYDKTDPFCCETTRLVYQEFKNNKEFQNAVLNSVKESIKDKEFSKEDYWKLCDYVLDEFSVVYHGIEFNKIYYGLYVYPDIDDVLLLIEDIKKGLKFPKLSRKLNDEKIGVAILR